MVHPLFQITFPSPFAQLSLPEQQRLLLVIFPTVSYRVLGLDSFPKTEPEGELALHRTIQHLHKNNKLPPSSSITKKLNQLAEWLQNTDNHLVLLGQTKYPELLTNIQSPPHGLFITGQNLHILQSPMVTLVGTRSPSALGQKFAFEAAAKLASMGITIVSGGANGIDMACHQGALSVKGSTIAGIAQGVLLNHPIKKLFTQNNETLLLSELFLDTPALPAFFPIRNRILTGLSTVTVVIECTLDSGTMISAKHALDQGRELLAVPGSPYQQQAAGPLQLIREGAGMVTNIQDILQALHHEGRLPQRDISLQPNTESIEQLQHNYPIVKFLDYDFIQFDELVARSNLPIANILQQISLLELEGHVHKSGTTVALRKN